MMIDTRYFNRTEPTLGFWFVLTPGWPDESKLSMEPIEDEV